MPFEKGLDHFNISRKSMKIYLAGTPGIISREGGWIKLYFRRLLSYWDIQQDQFQVLRAFNLIKETNDKRK